MKSTKLFISSIAILAILAPCIINYFSRRSQIERIYKDHYPLVLNISPDGKKVLLKDYYSNKFFLKQHDLSIDKYTIISEDEYGQFSPSFNHSRNQISYFLDPGGKQDYKIVVQDIQSGLITKISTPRVTSPQSHWSHDDKYIYLFTEDKHLIKVDLINNYKVSLVSEIQFSQKANLTWLKDKNVFAFISEPNVLTFNDLGLNKQYKLILNSNQSIIDFDWSNLSRKFLVASFKESDSIIEEVDENFEPVTLTTVKAEILKLQSTDDDLKIIYTVNSGFSNISTIYDRTTKQSIEIPGRFSHMGPEGMIYMSNFDPRNAGLFSFNTNNNELKKIYPKLNTPPSSFSFKEFLIQSEKRQIPALLWKSQGPNHPIVVMIHGGPRLNYNNAWQPILETFLANDIDVLLINYGGSSGYGKKFADELNYAVSDISATVEYLSEKKSYKKIFIYADSYGSGLASNAYENTNGKISGLFITSLFPNSFSASQFSHIPNKLLVFQGTNDSQCAVECAKAKIESIWGIDTSKVLFPISDEGHSFRKIDTWAYILDMMIENINH